MPTRRHDFDRTRARENLESFAHLVRIKSDQVRTRPSELGMLVSTALTQAALAAALGSPDPRGALAVAAHAGAALFSLARTGGEAVEVRLVMGPPVRLAGKVGPSTAHAGRWLDAWYAATTLRDLPSLGLLAACPAGLIRSSPTRGDEFLYRLVDAYQAFWRRDPTVEQHLFAALQATEPGGIRASTPDRVLHLRVPEIELFYRLLSRDAPAANAALRKAVECHRTYWSGAGRRNEPEGLIALAPLALACVGRDLGFAFDVTSEYLPAGLLEPPAPAPTLCCPYCITPLAEGTGRCPACGEDTGADAMVELSAEEYRAAPRHPCPFCGAMGLEIAVVCPVCRRRRRR
jgi:hypothetical protein